MQRFLEFIIAKGHWLLLILFEAIAIALLFNGSLYHRFLNITYSNTVVGKIYSVSGEVKGYLNLREKNRLLTEQLAQTELDYLCLQQQVDFALADSVTPFYYVPDSTEQKPSFSFVTARVISSTVNRRQNLVIIDKGLRDGITEQMGAMAPSGVAGIISSVSERYAVMVPLLNSDLKLSCKIKRTGYTGTLSRNDAWNSYAQLTDLSRHATYSKGDTVVTSGYSSVFPPNLFVGTIIDETEASDQITPRSSYVTVAPGADFAKLQFVYVITSGMPIAPGTVDSVLNRKSVR